MLRAKRKRISNQRGFTLIELLAVVAIIGIIAAIALPLYGSMQQRARIAKAQADTRALASAISIYMAHCAGIPAPAGPAATNCPTATSTGSGALPAVLFTAQQNVQNQIGGPFMMRPPSLPDGWSGSSGSYKYSVEPSGGFLICSTGDNTAFNSNGGVTCP